MVTAMGTTLSTAKPQDEVMALGFSDLRINQRVGVFSDALEFKVLEIDKVVDVDINRSKLGRLGMLCADLSLVSTIEPRIKLHCGGGSWYGYWYPLQSLFAKIDYNGYSERIVSVNKIIHLRGQPSVH